jgi:hypothetical protein
MIMLRLAKKHQHQQKLFQQKIAPRPPTDEHTEVSEEAEQAEEAEAVREEDCSIRSNR